MTKTSEKNVGVCHERTEGLTPCGQINLEAIFQKEWAKENTDKPGINSGLGIAQLLFCVSDKSAKNFNGPDRDDTPYGWGEVCVYNLSLREQKIIATIIQWLGTGFSFIQRCLEQAGYIIEDKSERKPLNRFSILKANNPPLEKELRDYRIHSITEEIAKALNGLKNEL